MDRLRPGRAGRRIWRQSPALATRMDSAEAYVSKSPALASRMAGATAFGSRAGRSHSAVRLCSSLPEGGGRRATAFETPSSLLSAEQREESGSLVGAFSMAEQGGGPRRLLSSPLGLLSSPPWVFSPPPWKGGGREGGDPGGSAARTETIPVPLIRESPGCAGVPPAWRAGRPASYDRASREAGGTLALPGGGTPLSTFPPEGGRREGGGRARLPGGGDVRDDSPVRRSYPSNSFPGGSPARGPGRPCRRVNSNPAKPLADRAPPAAENCPSDHGPLYAPRADPHRSQRQRKGSVMDERSSRKNNPFGAPAPAADPTTHMFSKACAVSSRLDFRFCGSVSARSRPSLSGIVRDSPG